MNKRRKLCETVEQVGDDDNSRTKALLTRFEKTDYTKAQLLHFISVVSDLGFVDKDLHSTAETLRKVVVSCIQQKHRRAEPESARLALVREDLLNLFSVADQRLASSIKFRDSNYTESREVHSKFIDFVEGCIAYRETAALRVLEVKDSPGLYINHKRDDYIPKGTVYTIRFTRLVHFNSYHPRGVPEFKILGLCKETYAQIDPCLHKDHGLRGTQRISLQKPKTMGLPVCSDAFTYAFGVLPSMPRYEKREISCVFYDTCGIHNKPEEEAAICGMKRWRSDSGQGIPLEIRRRIMACVHIRSRKVIPL